MTNIEWIIVIAGAAAMSLNVKVAIGWMRMLRLGTPRRVEMFYSAEDNGWIAVCDLPGISAFGDTPEEVLFELRTAYQIACQVYYAEGWELP